MEAEHLRGPEATDNFTTRCALGPVRDLPPYTSCPPPVTLFVCLLRSNYGITTTSKTEWHFVVSTDATPQQQLQLERWPEESVDRLGDRSKCRVKPVLAELEERAKPFNEQLVEAKNTELLRNELIAANLYTGPVSSRSPDPFICPLHAHLMPSHLCCRCSSNTTACFVACSRRAASSRT